MVDGAWTCGANKKQAITRKTPTRKVWKHSGEHNESGEARQPSETQPLDKQQGVTHLECNVMGAPLVLHQTFSPCQQVLNKL